MIGDEQWPFPVPLAKVRGGWQFDTDAGADEMISRRIGRNELRVIDVCRDYVSMQKAYASQPRDGKVAGLYAQKFRSSPGRQDGLYWRVGAEETPSPLGDLVAQAVGGGLRREQERVAAVVGVPLPRPDGPGSRREGRRQKLHRQWRDVRRIRA